MVTVGVSTSAEVVSMSASWKVGSKSSPTSPYRSSSKLVRRRFSSFSATDLNGPSRSPCWRARSTSSSTVSSAAATFSMPSCRAADAFSRDRRTKPVYSWLTL